MQKKLSGKLVVGLGNPGEEYTNTYHNVGLLMLDSLIGNQDSWVKHKKIFEYVEVDRIRFARSLTYMNESGKAIREAMKKFGIKPDNLIVLQDDSDITIGNYKISFARNSGGHKGVQSIIDALKTNAFTRVRIGIRPLRETKRQKAGDFALKQISKSDRSVLATVFEKIVKDYK